MIFPSVGCCNIWTAPLAGARGGDPNYSWVQLEGAKKARDIFGKVEGVLLYRVIRKSTRAASSTGSAAGMAVPSLLA